jgi:Protein of unknown function (DUF3592)
MQRFKTITLLVFLSSMTIAQKVEPQFLETKATITSIETRISGKRPRDIVTVKYVIETGDTIQSQMQFTGIPFLGSFKKVGDTLTIRYQKDNPYFIKTENESFLQAYGIYIIIAIAIFIPTYKYLKRKMTV